MKPKRIRWKTDTQIDRSDSQSVFGGSPFGTPARVDEIKKICTEANIALIEGDGGSGQSIEQPPGGLVW